MSDNKNTPPANEAEIEKAKALIEAEKKERAQKTWAEIEPILKANKCHFEFGINIGGQSVPVNQVLAQGIIMHVIAE